MKNEEEFVTVKQDEKKNNKKGNIKNLAIYGAALALGTGCAFVAYDYLINDGEKVVTVDYYFDSKPIYSTVYVPVYEDVYKTYETIGKDGETYEEDVLERVVVGTKEDKIMVGTENVEYKFLIEKRKFLFKPEEIKKISVLEMNRQSMHNVESSLNEEETSKTLTENNKNNKGYMVPVEFPIYTEVIEPVSEDSQVYEFTGEDGSEYKKSVITKSFQCKMGTAFINVTKGKEPEISDIIELIEEEISKTLTKNK